MGEDATMRKYSVGMHEPLIVIVCAGSMMALSTTEKVCRNNVDFPPMLGPVTRSSD